MDNKAWITRVSGLTAMSVVADAIEVSPSTFDSQIKNARGLKVETVLAIARKYGYSTLRALLDFEIITLEEVRDEVGLHEIEESVALAKADATAILTEIGRRLREREATQPSPLTAVEGEHLPDGDPSPSKAKKPPKSGRN